MVWGSSISPESKVDGLITEEGSQSQVDDTTMCCMHCAKLLRDQSFSTDHYHRRGESEPSRRYNNVLHALC